MYVRTTGTVWSNGRAGKYIKVNSGGLQRRRKGILRGTKLAPQGRPVKRLPETDLTQLLGRAKRPKNVHNLNLKVKACKQWPT